MKTVILLCATVCAAASQPVIRTEFHLTARPWEALNIEREQYLDVIEGICRFSVRHQDAGGAIIDPFLHREHQYATPYFAYAVGTLTAAGRARDLLANGVRAMEHSTANFASGRDGIPDQHGEFFIPALTEARRGVRQAGSGRDPPALARATQEAVARDCSRGHQQLGDL